MPVPLLPTRGPQPPRADHGLYLSSLDLAPLIIDHSRPDRARPWSSSDGVRSAPVPGRVELRSSLNLTIPPDRVAVVPWPAFPCIQLYLNQVHPAKSRPLSFQLARPRPSNNNPTSTSLPPSLESSPDLAGLLAAQDAACRPPTRTSLPRLHLHSHHHLLPPLLGFGPTSRVHRRPRRRQEQHAGAFLEPQADLPPNNTSDYPCRSPSRSDETPPYRRAVKRAQGRGPLGAQSQKPAPHRAGGGGQTLGREGVCDPDQRDGVGLEADWGQA